MAAQKPTEQVQADLPTNWQNNDIVSPDGTSVGLSQQHGYNYLMKRVNELSNAVNEINNAFTTLATFTEFNSHAQNKSNPHTVTKSQVGLGNVDNTSDLDKPLSTATKTELTKINEKLKKAIYFK